jgi:hypothetical protein
VIVELLRESELYVQHGERPSLDRNDNVRR